MSTNGQRVQIALIIFVAFVFIQSLFFKFTNSPETQYIFGTLDSWAGNFGFAGLFAPGGLFNAKVIGTAELIASGLLVFSLIKGPGLLRAIGALMGIGVISGAIFFHLFTPLGVAVRNTDGTSDGGLLLGMACGVWISCALLLLLNRQPLLALINRAR